MLNKLLGKKKSPAMAGEFNFQWMSGTQYSVLVRSRLEAE